MFKKWDFRQSSRKCQFCSCAVITMSIFSSKKKRRRRPPIVDVVVSADNSKPIVRFLPEKNVKCKSSIIELFFFVHLLAYLSTTFLLESWPFIC